MESISGSIGRIISHKISPWSESGNKFLIAVLQKEDGQSITIKGEMNSVVYGWTYKLYGEQVNDKWGKSFSFNSFEPVIDRSHDGMADFLARSIPQIGKVRARAIVDKFGNDSFTILKTDISRLSEIKRKDFTPKIIEQIQEYFESENSLEVDPAAYARLHDMLSPIHPPRRVITSLLKNFGSNAPQFISENPYKLLDYPGMGWDRVDRFAVDVLHYNPAGDERHRRASIEILSRNSESGNTKTENHIFRFEVCKLLGMSVNWSAVESLADNDEIKIDDEECISLSNLYYAEECISHNINRLQLDKSILEIDLHDDGFEDEQRLIPEVVMNNRISIISGIPGSGKSHSVSLIIKRLVNNGIFPHDIIVIAPTGKAAKRNDELIRDLNLPEPIECMTIHRLLGAQLSSAEPTGIPEDEARLNRGRSRFTFDHNEENMLEYSYYIIDECSMLDVELGASLFQAIPSDSRIILVGDHYQLPSVGPGSFLRDLMAAGVPFVVLDKPRRNSGDIAESCYLIKEGRNPVPKEKESNWTHLEIQDDEEILNNILTIHKNYISKFGVESAKINLQVISPEKKGVLGCNNLNRLLSAIVNPDESAPIPFKLNQKEDFESQVRSGDKVVRTRNGTVAQWVEITGTRSDDDDDFDEGPIKTEFFNGKSYEVKECYVVNGDIGEVIGFKGQNIIVRFTTPTRICALPRSDSRISLSYALTVHKMQGSSAPIVIMPLSSFYWNSRDNTGLFSRELIYTLFSRPSERLITVGRIAECYRAVSRVTTDQRKTRLKEMVKNALDHE